MDQLAPKFSNTKTSDNLATSNVNANKNITAQTHESILSNDDLAQSDISENYMINDDKYANYLSFQNISPVSIRVRDLSVGTRQKSSKTLFKKKPEGKIIPQKRILDHISFDLPAGSLMAIIGGSGSGKTTLLNVLADRSSSSTLEQNGSILYNDSNLSKIRNAYVIQQDILSPTLTTRETLQFATELRLPDITNSQERLKLVEEVILELGLKDSADTMVGDSTHKGLSGGEKRRLSIGIQLLSNPSLLFLDEPTTGLDAHSAFLLIKTLKNLSTRGRTIIVSIHQPRSDIFFLFDNLCILSQGQTVYNDRIDKVLEYFHNLSYDVPVSVNPADFLIDVTTVDLRTRESERQGLIRLAELAKSWKAYQKLENNQLNLNESIESREIHKTRAPFYREVKVLMRRTLLLTIRDKATFLSLICESVFMGIICGWVFYKPGNSLSGIRTIAGALYSANGLQGYLMLLFETYRLSSYDIKIFDRERADNCITVPGFLISRRIAKFFTEDILITLLFSVITYFMMGLITEARNFFIYWMTILIVHCASMTFATFSVAVSREFAKASLLANLNFTLQSFACGFFVNAKIMPVYVRWTKYIAFLWYGFGALIANQFTGFYGDCPYGDFDEVGCNIYNGDYIIESYGFWSDWIAVPLVVVLSFVILFYLAAAVALHFKRVDVSISSQVKSTVKIYEDELIKETTELTKEVIENDEMIDIYLSNIYLSVKLGNKIRKKKEKIILEDVTASFKAGKLNAIMGPSGSGKSSLLNLISGRLSSDLVNEYSVAGDISFNNFNVQSEMINKICSYVSQDDDHLLPGLSVRETLILAADLRVRNCNRDQKSVIVEDIINRLGLKACANTLVGSEFIKGISGGEKRRVSMAIQLLNNPKVLLLDEPTSGLDSFTASYILEILQNLANEGKTIILTIHQPRSDLFNKFGQVLLLAKGGIVGYNGEQAQMIEYFSNLGYPCPQHTNSADHVLDLISVNNQNATRETISKKRIDLLLGQWRDDSRNSIDLSKDQELTDSEFKQKYGRFIRTPAPFRIAFCSCLKQFSMTTFRDTNVIIGRTFNIVGLAFVLTIYTAQLKNNYESVQTRLGLLQQFTAIYFSGMLNNLSSYPQQRDYFYHEYNDRVYGISPFLLSYTVVEIPFEIFTCLLFSALAAMAAGLPRTPEFFFAVTYVSWMICLCGESLGIITNTLFKNAGFAVNTVSVFLAIASFMAGVMSLTMDSVLQGFNYLSPLKYGLSIILNMGFPSDLTFTCNSASENSDGSCIFANGTDVLVTYGLYNADYPKYFGVLVSVTVIYRLLAYVSLRLRLWKFNLRAFKKINHYSV